MEEKDLEITEEELKELTPEELVDLEIELMDMDLKVKELLEDSDNEE